MYHKVTLVGRLGQDPELRYTPSGVSVARFSVAANRQWTTGDGEKKQEVTWFRVTAWRSLGDICNQFLSKGRLVLIEGGLQPDPDTGGPRVWVGDDDKPRASFDLTARIVRFLDSNSDAPVEAEDEEVDESEEDSVPF